MELAAGQDISQIPGAKEGLNDRGTVGYIGPRPPIGTHRYFFKLYAVNTELSFERPPQRKRSSPRNGRFYRRFRTDYWSLQAGCLIL